MPRSLSWTRTIELIGHRLGNERNIDRLVESRNGLREQQISVACYALVPFPVRQFHAAEPFLLDRALDWMGASDLDTEGFQQIEGDDEYFPCDSIRRLPQFVGPIFLFTHGQVQLNPGSNTNFKSWAVNEIQNHVRLAAVIMTSKSSGTVSKSLRHLSNLCRQLADRLHASRNQKPVESLIRETQAELLAKTACHLDDRQLTDTIGQTLVQARVAWVLAGSRLQSLRGQPGLLPSAETHLGRLLRLAIGPTWLTDRSVCELVNGDSFEMEALLSTAESTAHGLLASASAGGAHIDFDTFLGAHDPRSRARHGVFFTPRPLAAFVVRESDRVLREEFQLPRGLADTTTWSQMAKASFSDSASARAGRHAPPRALHASQAEAVWQNASKQSLGTNMLQGVDPDSDLPFIRILDPAVGTGVFLRAVIEHVFAEFKQGFAVRQAPGENASEHLCDAWNEYVARNLLPRLHGRDLLLPACAVAQILIASQLAATGYRFESVSPVHIELADSLIGPSSFPPATVILGNPPFAALTTSGNAWIDGLLRSTSLNGQPVGGYYELDGNPLGERKLWLHDDYVKFLRFAQWQIAQAGYGVVGFVTNHGYLDNLTFRGVRRSLLNSFPRISVLDLHGNRKKREMPPDGGADDNVFGIDQGVAIGLFRRTPFDLPTQVTRADLWGSRDNKTATLQAASDEVTWRTVTPTRPHYFFGHSHPQSTGGVQEEYARGFSLDEIMPVHSTAAVTARDSFVVGFTAEEVLQRMRALAGSGLTEVELRERFFCHTRSRRYPSGDTRGWKLAAARERARNAGDLQSHLRRCLYRPFDWRWVFWAEWMIDWPRTEIMRHMLDGDNLALITRRQMIPNQPANYFFLADSIVIDGVIRSDNRGSESFFPLFLNTGTEEAAKERQLELGFPTDANRPEVNRRPNFSSEFVRELARHDPALARQGALEIFQLIYAQFHSTIYRERYQSELCLGFPRVFIPRQPELWRQLIACGRRLVAAHLTQANPSKLRPSSFEMTMPNRDWPRYLGGDLWITESYSLPDIAASTWEFQVGGYQVCRKWLRERSGRILSPEEIGRFRQITEAIAESVCVMREIDDAIEAAGGWPHAFFGKSGEWIG